MDGSHAKTDEGQSGKERSSSDEGAESGDSQTGETHPTSLLSAPTLVLNKYWLAINVTSVRRAIVMVFRGTARIIEPCTYEALSFEEWLARPVRAEHQVLRTARRSIRIPEVVVLDGCERPPRTHVPFSRRNLFRRDNAICQYCGNPIRSGEYSVDHVLPRSRGGGNTWENCVIACVRCNVRKGNRTPDEAGLKLMRLPKAPEWSILAGFMRGSPRSSWSAFLKSQRRPG